MEINFIQQQNVLTIIEDLVIQPITNFYPSWHGWVESLVKACYHAQEKYQRLVDQPIQKDSLSANLRQQWLLQHERDRLVVLAKALWQALSKDAQEALELQWLERKVVNMIVD